METHNVGLAIGIKRSLPKNLVMLSSKATLPRRLATPSLMNGRVAASTTTCPATLKLSGAMPKKYIAPKHASVLEIPSFRFLRPALQNIKFKYP